MLLFLYFYLLNTYLKQTLKFRTIPLYYTVVVIGSFFLSWFEPQYNISFFLHIKNNNQNHKTMLGVG